MYSSCFPFPPPGLAMLFPRCRDRVLGFHHELTRPALVSGWKLQVKQWVLTPARWLVSPLLARSRFLAALEIQNDSSLVLVSDGRSWQENGSPGRWHRRVSRSAGIRRLPEGRANGLRCPPSASARSCEARPLCVRSAPSQCEPLDTFPFLWTVVVLLFGNRSCFVL